MQLITPGTWDEALAAKAAHPDAVPLQGGTDVMVELNFAHRRPRRVIDLSRIPELREWSLQDEHVRLGAGVTYVRVIEELSELLPGLAIAARTVGSPQIRNRGTVGGNLGAASPAGDSHPPLVACRAEVELASTSATRTVAIDDFFLAPKRSAARPDELIAAVHVPVAAGPQQFAKIGTRNAMVIAVCSLSLAVDRVRRQIGVGIGSAGPTPLRAEDAERFLADALTEARAWDGAALGASARARFGELVAAAATPIDDVRGSRRYRLHALGVLALRLAARTLGGGAAHSTGGR